MIKITKLTIHHGDMNKVPIHVFSCVHDFGKWIAAGARDHDTHVLVWKWGVPGHYQVHDAPLPVRGIGTTQREIWYRKFPRQTKFLATGEEWVIWAAATHRDTGHSNPFQIITVW